MKHRSIEYVEITVMQSYTVKLHSGKFIRFRPKTGSGLDPRPSQL